MAKCFQLSKYNTSSSSGSDNNGISIIDGSSIISITGSTVSGIVNACFSARYHREADRSCVSISLEVSESR